jgi:hypothetical protein
VDLTQELELIVDIFVFPISMILDSSPESDPRSHRANATIFFFPLSLNFFGRNSGCNFQHCDSSCPFFLQWEHVGLSSTCFTLVHFLLFHFPFSFFSNLYGFLSSITCLPLLASRCVSSTGTLSMLVGLKINSVTKI